MLDQKAKKCIFIGYFLEQNLYKCYNIITKDVRVSRDVVLDKLETWYVEIKDELGANLKENVIAKNVPWNFFPC